MVRDLACRSVALMLGVALAVTAFGAEPANNADKSSPQSINVTSQHHSEEAALERALDQVVSADFRDSTMGNLPGLLKQYHVEAVLDRKALSDAGISSDATLPALPMANISLRSALGNLTRQFDLEIVNRNGRLVITSADAARNELQSKIYRVDDLLVAEDANRNQPRDYRALIEVIAHTVYPSTWDEVGGPGSIGPYQGTLLILQTYRVHRRVQQLLSALRENRDQQKRAGFKTIWADSPRQIAALGSFQQKATVRADFKFDETPLEDVATAISVAYDLPVMLDARAIRDASVAWDTPGTATLEQVSLDDVMDMLLREMDLTLVQNGEVVWITSPDAASTELSIAVYPIADLVQSGPIKIGAPKQDFHSLSELITGSIRVSSWDEVGGPATIEFHPATSSLVILQTRDVHADISRLLAGIREIRVPPTPSQAQAAEAERSRHNIQTKTYSLPAGLDGKTVVALILRLDARSWNRGGRTVQLNNNQIIVRHTGDMHRRIAELLGDAGAKQPQGGGGMGGGMM